jgi:hypothetical protein
MGKNLVKHVVNPALVGIKTTEELVDALKKSKEPQDQFDAFLLMCKDNPLLFIRVMFNAEPSLQQLMLMQDVISSQRSRVAVKSCTSSGKTACLSWLTLWGLAVQDDIRILITAPTFPLLNRVFLTEIQKWHFKMPEVARDMYTITQDKIIRKGNSTHRADLATASSENEQALAGGHSGNYWIIVDEGSAVNDDIYEVLLGTLSYGEGGRIIIASNPTRNTGFYHDLFADNNPYWKLHTFTAIESPNVTPQYIEEMAHTYGEDSDFYRVRILGEFPRTASSQFISAESVDEAMKRRLDPHTYINFPIVGGVDVARFGDDQTVFVTRQGPKILDITPLKGLNTMEVTAEMVAYYHKYRHHSVYVDGTGLGAGVVDRGRELKVPVVDVVVANKSSNPAKYVNLKSQLWGSMKEWLDNGADIPNDPELRKQLLSMEYGYNGKMQMMLMGKKDLKKKHGFSPDAPDAIALTFAEDAYLTVRRGASSRQVRQVAMGDFLWA